MFFCLGNPLQCICKKDCDILNKLFIICILRWCHRGAGPWRLVKRATGTPLLYCNYQIHGKLVLSLTVTGSTDNALVRRTYAQPRRDRKLARSVTRVLKCFMCVTEKQTLLSIGCLQTRHNRVVWRRTYLLKTLINYYNNYYYCYSVIVINITFNKDQFRDTF